MKATPKEILDLLNRYERNNSAGAGTARSRASMTGTLIAEQIDNLDWSKFDLRPDYKVTFRLAHGFLKAQPHSPESTPNDKGENLNTIDALKDCLKKFRAVPSVDKWPELKFLETHDKITSNCCVI